MKSAMQAEEGHIPHCSALALFGTAPVFGERVHPPVVSKVKIGLAALVAFLIGQNLSTPATTLWSVTGLWITAREIHIGAVMGLMMQFFFAAVRCAGEIIGLQMGLSFAAFYDPSGNQTMPVLARIMNMLFILLNDHLCLLNVLAVNLTLGLLNCLKPQLSIFVIGFPLSITLGMGALLLTMVNFAPLFDSMTQAGFHQLETIVQGLRPPA